MLFATRAAKNCIARKTTRFPAKPFYVFGTEDASVTLVTYGRMFSFACEAAETLEKEGIKCRIVKLNRIVPIDPESGGNGLKVSHGAVL